jgi:DNA polymerase elongation subunit (family B)
MSKPFRLIEFNVYDQFKSNPNESFPQKEEEKRDKKEFIVQMFAINERGQTCSIYVEGYKPFFYVKVPDIWTNTNRILFMNHLKDFVGTYYEDSIVKSVIIEKKKLYGFDGGKKYKFMRIEFKNVVIMNRVKNLWYEQKEIKGERVKRLKKGGYMFEYELLELYEANIPPLLRLFHIQQISPSGWVALPKNKSVLHTYSKKTSCQFEYTINYKHIRPIQGKETVVPYNMCSYDIEASSSHGDFPLAKKNYKKLAVNLVDIWKNIEDFGLSNVDIFSKSIYSAFGFDDFDSVDKVFPKKKISEELLATKIEKLLECKPAALPRTVIDNYGSNVDEEEEYNEKLQQYINANIGDDNYDDMEDKDDGEHKPKKSFWKYQTQSYKNKKGSIFDILEDESCSREIKINEINKAFNRYLPQLEGDKVTFIGSTFLKYGQDKPYLNHCIVLDTCDQPKNLENCVIESYKTEKEVLLAWTKIIQKEDPDLITGYNIFGFDYPFMFERAKELDCVEEFLQLSRNKGEICGRKNFKTGNYEIEENSIVIASGQHDIKFIKMPGRLQVDMYNYFRRDYNLVAYKLDYVSGHFIGDNIKEIEHIESNTKIHSKNLTGLENGNFINFEETSHSTDSYKDGQKFEVFDVNYKEGTFMIQGKEEPNMKKTVRWGLAKDDVTPQDIFRMTNEGPEERAIIAKYCIQDCNLVHHLIRKIDVITGYIEMAKLCSVPINFLVMRGQGIKLTSYIAKKCREKGVLIPVIEKPLYHSGYEGAIVLDPKCDLYLDEPVACVDYSSLYPSSMISDNISHDSKVWTKEYDLDGNLLRETGEKDENGNYKYDNMEDEGYKYVDIKYDTYKYVRKSPKAAAQKVKCGTKICRFAQFPDGKKGCLPAILEELLAARKATRKDIPKQKDDFMKNVLDKRQLSIKVTANSLYGQTGAGTSTFYEVDVAASTTAIGRKLLTYAQRVIEESFSDIQVETKSHGKINVDAEYVYGDSVTGDTPLLLRNKDNGEIIFKQIDEIHSIWTEYDGFKANESNRKNKEQSVVNQYEIYTATGWSSINRVIRHKTKKKMYRIATHTGIVDVTEDHSLLDENKKILKPTDVEVGMTLLHKYPEFEKPNQHIQLCNIIDYLRIIVDKTIEEKKAFLYGFFYGDGSCGKYNTKYGIKYSWALNNSNKEWCEILKTLLMDVYPTYDFKILNTMESSGVYKIVPLKTIKKFVSEYAGLFYNKNKYKIIPTHILNDTYDIRYAYFAGYYLADGNKCINEKGKCIRMDNKGKIGTSQLFYLSRSLGFNVSLNTREDKRDITRLTLTTQSQRKNPNIIKKIIYLGETTDDNYVYDIETKEGNFNTGFPLIVKNTDSVFFKFNPEELDGTPIKGQNALEITIELAQEAGKVATKFLKKPHDLEYEKTFMPFCLLSKKRYVGMLYELDPHKCKRKSMGIVLKRRDNAPIVKDVYGGVIDILMKDQDIEKGIAFLEQSLQDIVDEKCGIDKLIITKSLRSNYKNPQQIAHKVLADRIGKRDPGNKPAPGDRIPFVYVHTNSKSKLQGDKIEIPSYIQQHKLKINYSFYISNQIMKPVIQIFALVLEKIPEYKSQKNGLQRKIRMLERKHKDDREKMNKTIQDLRNKETQILIFNKYLRQTKNNENKNQAITGFFRKK